MKLNRSFLLKLIPALILIVIISLTSWFGYGYYQDQNRQQTDLNLKLQTTLNPLRQNTTEFKDTSRNGH